MRFLLCDHIARILAYRLMSGTMETSIPTTVAATTANITFFNMSFFSSK